MNYNNKTDIDELTNLLNNISLKAKDINEKEVNNLAKYSEVICENNNFYCAKKTTTTNFNIFEAKMATLTLDIDPLKYLNRLPEFSGDYRDLQNFVSLIDKVHPILLRYDLLGQSIFSDIIKSKLRGRAREIIEINNHVTCWLEIKEILINNFGDSSSMEELFDNLRGVSFKTNCVSFFNEIKIALRRLNVKTKLTLGEDLHLTEQTINNNKNSALTIFKNKIPEPMRSILYCRNPETLEAAMDILHESGYAYHNVSPPKRTQTFKTHNKNPNLSNRSTFNNNLNSNGTSFTNPPKNLNFSTNKFKPRNNYYGNNRNLTNINHNPTQTFPFRNNNPINQYYQREQNPPQAFHRNSYNNNFSRNGQQTFNNSFRNSHNENPINFQRNQNFPPPEPMDVNTAERVQSTKPENFHSLASTSSYPIS